MNCKDVRHGLCFDAVGGLFVPESARPPFTADAPRTPPAPRRPAPPAPKVWTVEELPCPYRGGQMGEVACVPCRSAGFSGAAVYACSVYGKCMLNNFSARNPRDNAVACVTCQVRFDLEDSAADPDDGPALEVGEVGHHDDLEV